MLAKSIEKNGFVTPIVIQKSTNYVVAGNHRVLAARKMKLKSIPARIVSMSDAESLRFLLADNRVSDESVYNEDILASLLESIREDDEANLEGTGYSGKEAKTIIGRAAWQREIKNVDLGTELPPEERVEEEEEEEYRERSVSARESVAHAEKNKDRLERLNAIARRTLTLSIPVPKHPEYVAALAVGRGERGVATNEELIESMLKECGYLDESFELIETAAKPKAKKKGKKKGK